mmetsp:Transcript_31922/g.31191  ORF Transcript_31922/g.31191 Transcript_31922/m.31191 type:complete len:126 (+) Transcript_31922:387-764(+)|eukprot:CAMPEP_0170543772 /NCGR_PEP_ID=MMETSP0211-20121228/2776_1 /TAXON_ID=311385 /ORGANISM="Pseudokeronopsis sp., Strain OXSARD2" /LENGTH=125 /DNA_ID=CAMNT_0010847237 /DNA_START=362 /DNA_END=739 /DNA_ORIENTATION=-
MGSINRSLAKLEEHSMKNWSQKDMDFARVATNSQTFNKLITATDPKIFKYLNSIKQSSKNELNQDSYKDKKKDYTFKSGTGFNNVMSYFSQKERKVMKGDVSRDFYKIGIDINLDGKHQYMDKMI